MIDQALKNDALSALIEGLEELEKVAAHITLENRDHIFHYLGMWDIYFAVQIPSLNVLRVLKDRSVRENPQSFMVAFTRDLLVERDRRFDQFCINIQTISKGHYAVLIPAILQQRIEELHECKIQYKEGESRQYCTADLLKTYYGQKIVSAAHGHRHFDVVVNEEQFATIRESLEATGLAIEPMLAEIDPRYWEEFVDEKRRQRGPNTDGDESISQYSELNVLHRVKSARSNIYSSDFNQQHSAITTMHDAKTHLCNDVLSDIATNPTHSLSIRAIRQLGEFGDKVTLDLLEDLMKNGRTTPVRREATRAYSTLSSRLEGLGPISPPQVAKPPTVDISEINSILNSLLSKGMPTTMIDETLSSVVFQGGSNAAEILLRLYGRPQERVRLAIVKASRLLNKEDAASIIRAALNDESSAIVDLAEKEIDSRWSDGFWD